MSNETLEALRDPSQLEYSQGLRRKWIEQFAADGKLPEDPKQAKIVLDMLNGHDKVTLTLMRIQADTDNGNIMRDALNMFHHLTDKLGAKDLTKSDTPVEGHRPTIDLADLGASAPAEGEMDMNPTEINYDEFMKEHSGKTE